MSSNAPQAGDMCLVVGERAPVRQGVDEDAASLGWLEQGDFLQVLRVHRDAGAGGRLEVCFRLSRGGIEGWAPLASEAGQVLLTVVPRDSVTPEVVAKIMRAVELGSDVVGADSGGEGGATAATAAAGGSAADYAAGDDAAPTAARPPRHPAAATEEGPSASSLTRQLSSHGPGYDSLLELGVPRAMLRRAWVLGGGNPDGAMEFIRANFDQPPEFWGGEDSATTRSDPAGDGATTALARQSSAKPALTALRRLGSGEAAPAAMVVLQNTLTPREMKLVQRLIPRLAPSLIADGTVVTTTDHGSKATAKETAAQPTPTQTPAPATDPSSVPESSRARAPPMQPVHTQQLEPEPEGEGPLAPCMAGRSASSSLSPSAAGLADPARWAQLLRAEPAFSQLASSGSSQQQRRRQIPTQGGRGDSLGCGDAASWMAQLVHGDVVEIDIASLPRQLEAQLVVREAKQSYDEYDGRGYDPFASSSMPRFGSAATFDAAPVPRRTARGGMIAAQAYQASQSRQYAPQEIRAACRCSLFCPCGLVLDSKLVCARNAGLRASCAETGLGPAQNPTLLPRWNRSPQLLWRLTKAVSVLLRLRLRLQIPLCPAPPHRSGCVPKLSGCTSNTQKSRNRGSHAAASLLVVPGVCG
jgi:hypothetical protein